MPAIAVTLVQRVDFVALIREYVDLDAILLQVDLDAVANRLDIDAVASRIDMQPVLARLDLMRSSGNGWTSTLWWASSTWTPLLRGWMSRR